MSAMDADVERLVRLSEEELAAYVRTRLLGRATAPMVVWSKGETPSPFLVYAYRESADPDFQARLRRVVNRLLRAWAPAAGDKVEYGARLMRLAGQLRIEDGADLLASLAFDPALDGLATDGELISSLALGTLLDFPGQEWRTDFWEPLWRDDRYFDAAFFAFCLQGPRHGLPRLGDYLRRAGKAGLAPGVIEARLMAVVESPLWTPRDLAELRRVVADLGVVERQKLDPILRRVCVAALEPPTEDAPAGQEADEPDSPRVRPGRGDTGRLAQQVVVATEPRLRQTFPGYPDSPEVKALYWGLSGATLQECEAILRDLCTEPELAAMAQRLRVFGLLARGLKYREIVGLTGASSRTIAAARRCMREGTGGYRVALDRVASP